MVTVACILVQFVCCGERELPVVVHPDAAEFRLSDKQFSELTSENPFVAAARIVPTDTSGVVMLQITGTTFPDWHIYAVDRSVEPNIPTSFALKLPVGWAPISTWGVPTPKKHRTPDGLTYTYEGDVLFERPLLVGERLEAPAIVECGLTFQACTNQSCLPSRTVTLTADVHDCGNQQSEIGPL